MPYGIVYDPMLEIASGAYPNIRNLVVVGHAPSGIQTTVTDFWIRADATPTQQIWLAPTAARVHAIVSSDVGDDGSPVGVGARTIRVTGLQTWSSLETSEDITLNGTTPVNTANSYVMINSMKVLTSGATSINVGTITATAATDSTVTAVIAPGRGQTEQAVYGIGSVNTAYIVEYHSSIIDATAGSRIEVSLRVNENPNVQTTNYIAKHLMHSMVQGSSNIDHEFRTFLKVPGPAIIKLQGVANAADLDAAADFELLVTTP